MDMFEHKLEERVRRTLSPPIGLLSAYIQFIKEVTEYGQRNR